jgi:hypothetical protein
VTSRDGLNSVALKNIAGLPATRMRFAVISETAGVVTALGAMRVVFSDVLNGTSA